MTSDPMQLIKEALPAIDLAIDQAMERDTTAENIQASYALKSIRAALQALTAASGAEREAPDALGKSLRSDAAVAMGYAPNYLGKIITISANNPKSNSFAERYDLAALGKILLNHLNRTATGGGGKGG